MSYKFPFEGEWDFKSKVGGHNYSDADNSYLANLTVYELEEWPGKGKKPSERFVVRFMLWGFEFYSGLLDKQGYKDLMKSAEGIANERHTAISFFMHLMSEFYFYVFTSKRGDDSVFLAYAGGKYSGTGSEEGVIKLKAPDNTSSLIINSEGKYQFFGKNDPNYDNTFASTGSTNGDLTNWLKTWNQPTPPASSQSPQPSPSTPGPNGNNTGTSATPQTDTPGTDGWGAWYSKQYQERPVTTVVATVAALAVTVYAGKKTYDYFYPPTPPGGGDDQNELPLRNANQIQRDIQAMPDDPDDMGQEAEFNPEFAAELEPEHEQPILQEHLDQIQNEAEQQELLEALPFAHEEQIPEEPHLVDHQVPGALQPQPNPINVNQMVVHAAEQQLPILYRFERAVAEFRQDFSNGFDRVRREVNDGVEHVEEAFRRLTT